MIPNLILSVLILALPSYQIRFAVGPVPITVLEIVVWLTALLCIKESDGPLWVRLRSFVTVERAGLRFAMAGFVATTTLAAVLSPATIAAAGIWKAYVIEAILAFYIVRWALRNGASWKALSASSALLITLIGSIALLQWHNPNGIVLWGKHFFEITDILWKNPATFRATSLFPYPNAIALLMAPLAFLCVPLLRQKENTWKLVGLIGFMFAGISVILADSNGGMVGIIAGLVVMMFLSLPRKRTTIILGTVATITVATVLFLHPKQLSQFTFNNYSGHLRLEQWSETAQLLKTHPIMGGGLANYQNAIAPYHNNKKSGAPFLYPHNLFLTFWTEFGFLGLLALIWVLGVATRTLYRRWRENRSVELLSVIGALTVILVHGMVDLPYLKNDLSVFFWILVALSTIY